MIIVICEDELTHRQRLEGIIKELMENKKYNHEIIGSFSNPQDVIRFIKQHRNDKIIYFLDVDLESNMNGVELAREIRKLDPVGNIIFTTSHLEYSLVTFRYKVSALDYIMKQDATTMKKRIKDCFDAIYEQENLLDRDANSKLTINSGGEVIKVNFQDIMFIETSGMRKLKVHTQNEHLEFYGTLKDLEEKLDERFYKVHRSYIVNKDFVKKVDKINRILYLTNGEQCYVSVRYMKGVTKTCLTL